ncbi:hypothetical protein ACR30L_09800 [Psychromonas sp. PT13]|uniref:hypothetical protein n=1 Tax=Psychromonas sp. PT13 TaxID=3439547 RepID=UPI003EC0184F
MTTKKICSKRWVYTLYNVDGEYILSVVFCNSYVDFSRAFKISSSDISDKALMKLTADIIENHELYKKFEVPHPSISESTEE